MSSLLDLPIELLDQTLAPCSTSTISKLSRVNKGLYAFLTPRLYESIDWHWEDDADPPPFHLLLRTLLRNPLLAPHVKSLRLRGGGVISKKSWCESPCAYFTDGEWKPMEKSRSIDYRQCFSMADRLIARDLIKDIYRPPTSSWMAQLERGSVDVLVALIISQLVSIVRLDLGFGYVHLSHFIPAVLRKATVNYHDSGYFPELQSVSLGVDGPIEATYHWGELDLLRPFFFLPNVTSVDSIFSEPVLFAWPGKTPQSHSITSLTFTKSTLLEDSLKQILSATPYLKHLTYERVRHSGMKIENIDKVKCSVLDEALSSVSNTLESLVLKVKFIHYGGMGLPRYVDYPLYRHIVGRVKSLRKMLRLTSLEISWELLFGRHEGASWELCCGNDADISVSWPDSLPESLRAISMRDDSCVFRGHPWTHDIIFGLFKELLADQPTYFRRLENVSLMHVCGGTGDNCSDLRAILMKNGERLSALCASQNIKCDFKTDPTPWMFYKDAHKPYIPPSPRRTSLVS